eukprot:c36278_g1_i1 orf=3-227(+)
MIYNPRLSTRTKENNKLTTELLAHTRNTTRAENVDQSLHTRTRAANKHFCNDTEMCKALGLYSATFKLTQSSGL